MNKKRIRQLRKWSLHHLIPVSRGGKYTLENLIDIPKEKHNAWHILFGNCTLDEIIDYLTSLKQS